MQATSTAYYGHRGQDNIPIMHRRAQQPPSLCLAATSIGSWCRGYRGFSLAPANARRSFESVHRRRVCLGLSRLHTLSRLTGLPRLSTITSFSIAWHSGHGHKRSKRLKSTSRPSAISDARTQCPAPSRRPVALLGSSTGRSRLCQSSAKLGSDALTHLMSMVRSKLLDSLTLTELLFQVYQ